MSYNLIAFFCVWISFHAIYHLFFCQKGWYIQSLMNLSPGQTHISPWAHFPWNTVDVNQKETNWVLTLHFSILENVKKYAFMYKRIFSFHYFNYITYDHIYIFFVLVLYLFWHWSYIHMTYTDRRTIDPIDFFNTSCSQYMHSWELYKWWRRIGIPSAGIGIKAPDTFSSGSITSHLNLVTRLWMKLRTTKRV